MQIQNTNITRGRIGSYGFGFNGKEKTNEVYGEGNCYDYGFRIYDPRIARFLSVDPLSSQFPWYTPYQFAGNKPINCIDLDGLEDIEVHDIDRTNKTAILTIHYTDMVITSGPGAVDAKLAENLAEEDSYIDISYKQTWNQANKKGYKLYLNTLPESGKDLDEATQEDIDKGNAWILDVQFDVKVEVKEGYTYSDFINEKYSGVEGKYSGTGAIISGDGSLFKAPKIWDTEGVTGGATVGTSETQLRPGSTGGVSENTATTLIHEEGHKWGLDHEKGDYSQKGMMNNIYVVPSLDKVKDIINYNKSTIRQTE